jgi:hypothetical protein
MSTPANAPYKITQRAFRDRSRMARVVYAASATPAQRYTDKHGRVRYRPWPNR